MRAPSTIAIVAAAVSSVVAAGRGEAQIQPGEPPAPGAPIEPTRDTPPDVDDAPAPGSEIEEGDAIAFRLEQPRTRNQLIVLGVLAGGTAVFGGAGLLFHLDSRSKSDEVSRLGESTGLVWTQEREDTRASAVRSRNLAIGGYAVGGALLVTTVVALILTEPADKVVTYGVAPTEGGAFVGATWSFR